jgi:lipoprotein-releasing system ATP-binding protein
MILKATKLSKSYFLPKKVTILKEVSFSVDYGQSFAIVGPSGVGKSTLLHILGTLEKPSSGSLEILGLSSFSKSLSLLRNQHIGFVFQNFNLLEEYSVLDNILMPARVGRKHVGKGSQVRRHAEELLERVDLCSHRDQLAKTLSGGEKQRVAIARAFCNQPDLILADEPSGNLDETNSQLIHNLLISSCKDFGKALIVVTHNRDLASLCDTKSLLKDGLLTSF